MLMEDGAEDDIPQAEDFDRVCGNCHGFFPFMPNTPCDDMVCLWDPEFEPYWDEILAKESLDCCRELAERKRRPMDHEPCAKFEMCDFIDAT